MAREGRRTPNPSIVATQGCWGAEIGTSRPTGAGRSPKWHKRGISGMAPDAGVMPFGRKTCRWGKYPSKGGHGTMARDRLRRFE